MPRAAAEPLYRDLTLLVSRPSRPCSRIRSFHPTGRTAARGLHLADCLNWSSFRTMTGAAEAGNRIHFDKKLGIVGGLLLVRLLGAGSLFC